MRVGGAARARLPRGPALRSLSRGTESRGRSLHDEREPRDAGLYLPFAACGGERARAVGARYSSSLARSASARASSTRACFSKVVSHVAPCLQPATSS